MPQPHSIRFHLAAVFLVFFLLVVVLGLFSIWRLSNFNLLSADVAERWLPTTRALGDLSNYTSDFRAIEGSNLLSSDASETAATEREMAKLDRSIAEAERGFERIRHDAAEDDLYARFKQRWNEYREIVNRMLVLSRGDRKAEAQAIYAGSSRAAYDAASDTLGKLTDKAVANARARQRPPRRRLSPGVLVHPPEHGDRRRHGRRRAHPYQPFDLGSAAASRRPHAPARRQRYRDHHLRDRTARRNRRDGAGRRRVSQQRDRADAQPADAGPPGRDARGATGAGAAPRAAAAQFRVHGLARVPHAR